MCSQRGSFFLFLYFLFLWRSCEWYTACCWMDFGQRGGLETPPWGVPPGGRLSRRLEPSARPNSLEFFFLLLFPDLSLETLWRLPALLWKNNRVSLIPSDQRPTKRAALFNAGGSPRVKNKESQYTRKYSKQCRFALKNSP